MGFNEDIRNLMGVPTTPEDIDIKNTIGSDDEKVMLYESCLLKNGFKEEPIDLYSGDLETRSQRRFTHPKITGELVLDVYDDKVAGWFHHNETGVSRKRATVLNQGAKAEDMMSYLRSPKRGSAAPKRATIIINDMSFHITGITPSQMAGCVDYLLESVEDKEEYKVSIDSKGYVRRVE